MSGIGLAGFGGAARRSVIGLRCKPARNSRIGIRS